jgi:hypothetical protein
MLSPIFAGLGFSLEPAETVERADYGNAVRKYTLARKSGNGQSLKLIHIPDWILGKFQPDHRDVVLLVACAFEANSTLFAFSENLDAPEFTLRHRRVLGGFRRSSLSTIIRKYEMTYFKGRIGSSGQDHRQTAGSRSLTEYVTVIQNVST